MSDIACASFVFSNLVISPDIAFDLPSAKIYQSDSTATERAFIRKRALKNPRRMIERTLLIAIANIPPLPSLPSNVSTDLKTTENTNADGRGRVDRVLPQQPIITLKNQLCFERI